MSLTSLTSPNNNKRPRAPDSEYKHITMETCSKCEEKLEPFYMKIHRMLGNTIGVLDGVAEMLICRADLKVYYNKKFDFPREKQTTCSQDRPFFVSLSKFHQMKIILRLLVRYACGNFIQSLKQSDGKLDIS